MAKSEETLPLNLQFFPALSHIMCFGGQIRKLLQDLEWKYRKSKVKYNRIACCSPSLTRGKTFQYNRIQCGPTLALLYVITLQYIRTECCSHSLTLWITFQYNRTECYSPGLTPCITFQYIRTECSSPGLTPCITFQYNRISAISISAVALALVRVPIISDSNVLTLCIMPAEWRCLMPHSIW